MESALDFHTAKALLRWQVEMGATEAIQDVPVNRYDLPDDAPVVQTRAPAAVAKPAPPPVPDPVDHAAQARAMAGAAQDLAALQAALEAFEGCELKKGARTTVFADGNPAARVMIVGEAPGRDEDLQGKPFVGRAGQLLDKMLAAIDLSRNAGDAQGAVYITNVLPWRPPQNREPTPEEMAMLLPFVQRHIELASPEILILMGNISCQALLGRRGITRLRGQWAQVLNRPALPMFHPAYLLRTPSAKREAWADLLALQARLRDDA